PPTPSICALSLHDALPIYPQGVAVAHGLGRACGTAQVDPKHDPMQTGIDACEGESCRVGLGGKTARKLDHVGDGALVANFVDGRSEEHTSELQSLRHLVCC